MGTFSPFFLYFCVCVCGGCVWYEYYKLRDRYQGQGKATLKLQSTLFLQSPHLPAQTLEVSQPFGCWHILNTLAAFQSLATASPWCLQAARPNSQALICAPFSETYPEK